MKEYEKAEIEIIILDQHDILTNSWEIDSDDWF